MFKSEQVDPSSAIRENQTRQRGIALLIVLFGLALVTTLLISAIGLSSAHVKLTGYEARQQDERSVAMGAAELAGALIFGNLTKGVRPSHARPVPALLGERSLWVQIRDVGGLLDINSAAVPLIERLIEGLGEESDPILEVVRARRQSAQPFQSVEAFTAVAMPGPSAQERITPLLTVYSGHRGIAPEAAPEALLMALGGSISTEFTTPLSNRVFVVSVWVDDLETRRHDFVISVTAGKRYEMKLLEFNR